MGMYPTSEFKERPQLMDAIEADHMQAMMKANALERERARDTMKFIRELNAAAYQRANQM